MIWLEVCNIKLFIIPITHLFEETFYQEPKPDFLMLLANKV